MFYEILAIKQKSESHEKAIHWTFKDTTPFNQYCTNRISVYETIMLTEEGRKVLREFSFLIK